MHIFYKFPGRDNDRWIDFFLSSIDFIAADSGIGKIRLADLAYLNLSGITDITVK
jgi:hypothetical protein